MADNIGSENAKQVVVPSNHPLITALIVMAEKYNEMSVKMYEAIAQDETVKVNLREFGKKLAEISLMVVPVINASVEANKKKNLIVRALLDEIKAGGKPIISANRETVEKARDPREVFTTSWIGRVMKKPFTDRN